MLFDLRGRGKRRTIQAIYLSLAVLMGGGLVFFGVGGTGVGLFNTDSGGGAGGGSDVLEKKLQAAERVVKARPRDPAAWAELTRQRYQNADYDNNAQAFTPKGLEELRAAERAWDRYLALKPPRPDPTLARLMTNAFAADVLNRPPKEVEALEIVTARQPSPAAYAQLAVAAYTAGQIRKGDLARGKALTLTPKSERSDLRSRLDDAKTQAATQGLKNGGGTPQPSG